MALKSLFLVVVFVGVVQAETTRAAWVRAWYMAPQAATIDTKAPLYLRAPTISNATIREIVRPTISGAALRLHISNRFGKKLLTIGEVTIGQTRGVGAVSPGTLRQIYFGGQPNVTIPAGSDVVSDPVVVPVVARRALSISLFVPHRQRGSTWHMIAGRVNFRSEQGNRSMDPKGTAFLHHNTNVLWLDAVDIRTKGKWAVVAAGDSITDGLRATLNAQRRWPDYMSRRLRIAGFRYISVLNAGISGNRLLHGSACYGSSLLSRFGRDAVQAPGVRAVIVLIGINDINFGYTPLRRDFDCDAPHARIQAAELIAGYRELIAQAHKVGVKIFGATITPAGLSPEKEAVRIQTNSWIRHSGAFDGVVDFDAALRDPAHPSFMSPHYDSGDHIHPNDSGDAAMANVVPLSMFSKIASADGQR